MQRICNGGIDGVLECVLGSRVHDFVYVPVVLKVSVRICSAINHRVLTHPLESIPECWPDVVSFDINGVTSR